MKLEDEEKKQASTTSESAFSIHQSSELPTDSQRKLSGSEFSPKTPHMQVAAVLEQDSFNPEKVQTREILDPEFEQIPAKPAYVQSERPAKAVFSEAVKTVESESARLPAGVYIPSQALAPELISTVSKMTEPLKAPARMTAPEPAKPGLKAAEKPLLDSKEADTDAIPELVFGPRVDNKPVDMFIVEPPSDIPPKPPSESRVRRSFQKPPGRSLASEETKQPPCVFSPSGSLDMAEVEDMEITPAAPSTNAPKAPVSTLQRIEEEPRTSPPPVQSPLSIEVVNPRTVAAGWFGSGYTLYTVQTRQLQKTTEVERRFRDLDWMHTQLSAQFKGVSIPPLPEKPLFGTQSAKFIEERRAQMEKYLNMIAQSRVLSCSKVMETFLYAPLDKFEERKTQAEIEAKSVPFTGVEDVVDHLMAKIHSKINSTLISNIAPPSKEIVQLETHLGQLSAPTSALSTAFAQWVQGSRDMVSTLEDLEVPGNDQFTQVSVRLGMLENTALREMEKLAMDYREEVMRIEGILNVISTYQATSEQYAQQDALIQRKKGKKLAYADEDTSGRYQSEIDQAKSFQDSLKAELTAIQCNLEADGKDFSQKRDKHLWSTLQEAANCQVKRWQVNSQFWRDLRP